MPRAHRFSPATACIAAACLGACLAAPSALAQWKWRDDTGRVQYSDRPPPAGIADKNILAKPPGYDKPTVVVAPIGSAASSPASAPVATGKSKATDAEAKRRETMAAEDAKQATEQARIAKQQAENCQRAREYARTLDSGVRISRMDASGERVVMDDSQRTKEMSRAQEVIASDCKP